MDTTNIRREKLIESVELDGVTSYPDSAQLAETNLPV
jgi:hypothetical protein